DQPVRHAVRGRARYCVRPRVVFRAGAARRNGRARLSARAGVAPSLERRTATMLRIPMRLTLFAVVTGLFLAAPAFAWEPTKPIEFVIPAGAGGGADQMARLIAGIAEKHKLSPRPFIVVNKSGGAGAEGFLHVKGKKGDAHTIIITLSNLFTTPLHTGVPFSWKDLTPVARLALDQFILWVNAETPYKTAKEYLAAVKEKNGTMKMGGTGSAQEDQILTIMLEQAQGVKFIYVPFKGGGEVCVSLVGKQ